MTLGPREGPGPGRFRNLDLRDASSFEAQDRRIMALPSPLQRGFDGQAHWCVTRVVGTPVAAYTGPPRGLTKHASTLVMFSKCLVKHKIAPGASQSCQTACRYHGQCGGKLCAASRPGPGPGRAGFRLYTFALPLPAWLITGRIPPSPRRNSADSTAGCRASTLVGHTCGWDPRSGKYRAATGPHRTCIDTCNFF